MLLMVQYEVVVLVLIFSFICNALGERSIFRKLKAVICNTSTSQSLLKGDKTSSKKHVFHDGFL